jgi:hypothetical protein
MILLESLQASAKRVVWVLSLMIVRRACYALAVIESASSRMISLWQFSDRLTFFCAKDLIFCRTTSIPRSSEALSSHTAYPIASPSISRARHMILVVFPQPGGPTIITFGKLPYSEIARSYWTALAFPTISASTIGLYFSTHGISKSAILFFPAQPKG